MAHLHNIYDSDSHFVIDKATREIKNESTKTITLIQFDHNSERFTFELPRHIDGHDMSLCNIVEVYYINIDRTKKQENHGCYKVDDLQVSPDSDDVVICSWLISEEATRLAGPLTFLLKFVCSAETGVIDYAWHSAIYTGVTVSNGIDDADIIAEQYMETIREWENRLLLVENSIGSSGISPIITVTPINNGSRLTIMDANGTKFVEIFNGGMNPDSLGYATTEELNQLKSDVTDIETQLGEVESLLRSI